MRRFFPGIRRAGLGLFVLLVILWVAVPSAADTVRRDLGDGTVAAWTDQHRLFLEASPRNGEGLYSFARRFTGTTATADEISAANDRPRRLLVGVRYRIPYRHLSDEHKLRVIRALFPRDGPVAGAWRHHVPRTTRGATLWRICEWFTGRGETFRSVGRHNGSDDYEIRPGQSLEIPAHLLLPPFAAAVAELGEAAAPPPPPPPPPVQVAEREPDPAREKDDEPPPRTEESRAEESQPPAPDDVPGLLDPPVIEVEAPSAEEINATAASGALRFETGADGERYAVYHLKRGEALYTAVVVRFTGRLLADAVNELAAELAELNRIRDVTDMPVGQRVRIPVDLLLPEFLPPGDPRRVEWEQNRAATAQYSNTVRASRLEGIHVILDAGHGGDDPGVDYRGTWESVYVYDVMVRVKDLLEQRTAARVWPTTRDGDRFRADDRDVLPRSEGHHVLTSPPYRIRDHVVGTHLRWYLANSIYRRSLEETGDPGKTIFLSLHADSLHPTLRGSMAYVPSTSLTRGEYGKSGTVYRARMEVREQPTVSYSWKERTRSEGLSRQLAGSLFDAFRRHGLRVHPEKPVRDRIIRSRRSRPFVPAVVRYNAVPTKLLLEICNMNNPQDRQLLRTVEYRQKVARAIVDGILAYYGQEPIQPPPQVAAGP